MIKDYIAGLGLDAVKDRIVSQQEEKLVRERINDFIERKDAYNLNCTREEEIDFGGLVEYLSENFLDDVKLRLFGTRDERAAARNNIRSKAQSYAQEHSLASQERAIKLTETSVDILRDFYKRKIHRDLKFIAAEIEDDIEEAIQDSNKRQTGEIKSIVQDVATTTEQNIVARIQKDNPMSLGNNMQLMREGKIETVQNHVCDFFNAIGTTHKLYPDYCYVSKGPKHQFYSKPMSQEAIQKYPPKIRGTATMEIAGKNITRFDANTVDFAHRHQFPMNLKILTATKFLGNIEDPIQYEAINLVGKTICIPPEPFPPAIPCNVSFNGEILLEYILFRTEEILDDGTIIISNKDQTSCCIMMQIASNPVTGKASYNIRLNNQSNDSKILYLKILQFAYAHADIIITCLNSGIQLTKAKLNLICKENEAEDIAKEVDFRSMVKEIESYYSVHIDIPDEVSEDDYDIIKYLATLLRRESYTWNWSKFEFTVPLNAEIKNSISAMSEQSVFGFSFIADLSTRIFNQTLNFSVMRELECVKFYNIEKLKKKIAVLDFDDILKVCLLPCDDAHNHMKDTLHEDKKN